MMLPKIGILAGQGIDGAAWKEQVGLPGTYDWRIIQSSMDISPLDLSGFVWLWKPGQTLEQLHAEQAGLEQWVRSLLRHRKNNLIPIVVAAVEPVSQLQEPAREEAVAWLQGVCSMMRKVYQQELQSWAPDSLTDASRILLQADRPASGQHLSDAMSRLRTSITMWQSQLRRRAEQCMVIGMVLIALYVTLLLVTVPWGGSSQARQPRTELTAWSPTDWQSHLSECRKLLAAIQGRTFTQLSPVEQQQFAEHLRWLPLSLDWLQQKNSTREVIRLRAQTAELSETMENLVDQWTSQSTGSLVEQAALQSTTRQMLEGVFDPRPPPTSLHQASRRYWLGERAVLVHVLRGLMTKPLEASALLTELRLILTQQIDQVETCRVHAPDLKTAWQTELHACNDWLDKLQSQPGIEVVPECRKEGTPSLLREAAARE